MTYQEQIYNVENEARKYICDKLDEVTEITLFDLKKIEHEPEVEVFSEFIFLPAQEWERYYYIIVRLYKEGDQYYAYGWDEEYKIDYNFNLWEEIESMCMARLADFIKQKYGKDNV